jgi:RimJ/RimL family protein N-acetyltransferase
VIVANPSAFDPQPTLTGPTLTLSPTSHDDWDLLFAVAADPLIWEVHPSPDRWREHVFREFFADGMASGGMLTARDTASGEVVGSSRFSTAFAEAGEVEIGWTFLSRAHWGGATNREMKHLMLTHAFASLETVIFCVGERNGRSRRAVEKLGGRLLDRAAHAARPDHVTYAIRRADFRG